MSKFTKPSGRTTDQSLTDAMRDHTEYRSSDVEAIEIHKNNLVPDPTQPRKHFDQEVLDRRRQQLESEGQLSPITVFPGERGEDGELYYPIHDGECRWRAIQDSDEIDYLRAEITSRDPSDVAGKLVSQLTHNDDGAEPLTALEKAYAYDRIVQELEAQGVESPKSVAAQRLGLGLSVFSETLSLAKLPEELGKFALEQGVSDAKVLNNMLQVHKNGKDKDVQTMRQRISEGVDQGSNLRKVTKELVDQVKSRKPKKASTASNKKKTEKPSRLLTAKELQVKFKDDEKGVMTVETPREVIRLNVTKEQLAALMDQDST